MCEDLVTQDQREERSGCAEKKKIAGESENVKGKKGNHKKEDLWKKAMSNWQKSNRFVVRMGEI